MQKDTSLIFESLKLHDIKWFGAGLRYTLEAKRDVIADNYIGS